MTGNRRFVPPTRKNVGKPARESGMVYVECMGKDMEMDLIQSGRSMFQMWWIWSPHKVLPNLGRNRLPRVAATSEWEPASSACIFNRNRPQGVEASVHHG
ncbi:hypothetical protein NL676_034802 [Syzygium grande]|nr:hypothetical protein NL676_034802 [Syzygium grande]